MPDVISPRLEHKKWPIVQQYGLAILLVALATAFGFLLSNAIKFVAPGTRPRILIWAEEVQRPEVGGQTSDGSVPAAESERFARIWVEDNGIGIAKEDQPKLFQMFKRMTNEYEGTGIGLALVRKNTERMGGKVGVESKPGSGSRFWLELKQV